MRRVMLGIVWFVVLYVIGAAVVGIGAGVMDSLSHAGAGSVAAVQALHRGEMAGVEVGTAARPYVLLAAVLLAAVGSGLGWLPGTRRHRAGDGKVPPVAPSSDMPRR